MNDKLLKQMKLLDDPAKVRAIFAAKQIRLDDTFKAKAKCGSMFKAFTMDGWKCLGCFVWNPFEVRSAIYSLPPGVTEQEASELFHWLMPNLVAKHAAVFSAKAQGVVDDLVEHAKAAEKAFGKHYPERQWLPDCVPSEN